MSDAEHLRNDDPNHQVMAAFIVGDIASGYHLDLRGKPASYGGVDQARAWMELFAARREHLLPVTMLQLGLGAWQRALDPQDADADRWRSLARDIGAWAVVDMDGHGRFAHRQPMPHTYRIPAPWYSAMAQGLGVSLLVRTGDAADAERAAISLLDARLGLVYDDELGTVLEEYPAEPRPHVLNGWMWALLGLYDLSLGASSERVRDAATLAWESGISDLARRLPHYETNGGWSTYDLYPHTIANVASPFYHALHVQMLDAVARVTGDELVAQQLRSTARRWEAAAARRGTRTVAVARKVAFRLVTPRRRQVA